MAAKKRISLVKYVDEAICYGRYELLMRQLLKQLPSDYSWKIYGSATSGKMDSSQDDIKYANIPFANSGLFRRLGLGRLLAFLHAVWSSELIVVVGTPTFFLIPFARYIGRCKIIIHPDILPARWLGKHLLIKLRNKIYEKIAVKYAHMVIVDTPELQQYLMDRYEVESSLIPFGEDHEVWVSAEETFRETYPFSNEKYALHICKISPSGPAEVILKGFAQFPRYHLVMVANWNDSARGKKLRKHFSRYENIHLLDPVYDWESLNYLKRNAFIYIHFREGWAPGLSLIEAQSLSLPILAFDMLKSHPVDQAAVWYFSHTNHMISQLEKSVRQVYFQDTTPAVKTGSNWQDFIHRLDMAIQYCFSGLAKNRQLDFDSFFTDKQSVAPASASLISNSPEISKAK